MLASHRHVWWESVCVDVQELSVHHLQLLLLHSWRKVFGNHLWILEESQQVMFLDFQSPHSQSSS